MKRVLQIFVFLVLFGLVSRSEAEVFSLTTSPKKNSKPVSRLENSHVDFRGWGYLVYRLAADGLDQNELNRIYNDSRMPRFSPVPFDIRIKEDHQVHKTFFKPASLKIAEKFLTTHKEIFLEAHKRFGVNPYVVAAITLVETNCGGFTGKDRVLVRLSRLASVGEPKNLELNYVRLKKKYGEVDFEKMVARARYLEQTFYPEIHALLELADRNTIDPLMVKGSSAGAFGIPQFLPSSYLKFGVDGNNDRMVSLFNAYDAIMSAANYLSKNGWDDNGDEASHRKAIWSYNHSEAYINTVLGVAEILKERDIIL